MADRREVGKAEVRLAVRTGDDGWTTATFCRADPTEPDAVEAIRIRTACLDADTVAGAWMALCREVGIAEVSRALERAGSSQRVLSAEFVQR
jgi:hypothetical protein